MLEAPPTNATQAEINAYVTTKLWVVTTEMIGCPFLVGQVMRVTSAAGLGPVSPKRLCIVPALLSMSDERFAGTFGRVKPFVQRYLNATRPRIGCSGNIILEIHHAAPKEDRPDPDQRTGSDRQVDVHQQDAGAR